MDLGGNLAQALKQAGWLQCMYQGIQQKSCFDSCRIPISGVFLVQELTGSDIKMSLVSSGILEEHCGFSAVPEYIAPLNFWGEIYCGGVGYHISFNTFMESWNGLSWEVFKDHLVPPYVVVRDLAQTMSLDLWLLNLKLCIFSPFSLKLYVLWSSFMLFRVAVWSCYLLFGAAVCCSRFLLCSLLFWFCAGAEHLRVKLRYRAFIKNEEWGSSEMLLKSPNVSLCWQIVQLF